MHEIETADTHTHIFIAGLNRSGTSLLHHVLRSHPKISGFTETGVLKDEGQHLQSVYPIQKVFGGAGKFAFHPESHLDETSELVTESNRKQLRAEWGRHWDLTKPFLVEKSPPNIVRMRFLQAMFPNSMFIVILRHPLATGYATQKWSRTNICELIEHWVRAHRIMLKDLLHLRKFILVRYEDLVMAPQRTFDLICAWLDVYSSLVSEEIDNRINEKYFAMWEAETATNTTVTDKAQAFWQLPDRFGYQFRRPYVGDWSIEAMEMSQDRSY